MPGSEEKDSDKSRRTFLKEVGFLNLIAATLGRSVAISSSTSRSQSSLSQSANKTTTASKKEKKFVAIQIGARSFVDEGVDKCLDTLQERAAVNVLMPTVFTYGRGLAGRQIPGQPLPDPELGEFDVLAHVIPKARSRGMQVYCLFEEAYNPRLIPNFEKIAEVDMYGKIGGSTCHNNPETRLFLASMVKDWVTNNDVDGVMWESERQGPLNNTLQAHFGRISKSTSINCFCPHCERKANESGINIERARQGYLALNRWVEQNLSNMRPNDGSSVSLWRLLLEYPEILAWESFWFRSQEEVYGLLYGTAKEANSKAQGGWHIMHLVTMSPLYRAEQDYARLAQFSDFIKPSTYNNCGGPRFAQYIRNIQSTFFRDCTPEDVLELHYRFLGYENEVSLDKLPTTGLSADYVARETRRAIGDVQDSVPIYPGIDIDIPAGLNEKRTQPSDVKAAVLAAFEAGAPGVVLSRKYAEMRLTNLAGAGEALRELGL